MKYELILMEAFLEAKDRMKARHGDSFRKQLEKTLRFLAEDIRHPGLQVHGIRGWDGWKEAYINKKDRLLFRVEGTCVIVAWCGPHDELDRATFKSALLTAEKQFFDP